MVPSERRCRRVRLADSTKYSDDQLNVMINLAYINNCRNPMPSLGSYVLMSIPEELSIFRIELSVK